MTSAKWTLVIGKFSVILGIDYKVVSNERMGHVKVWKESKNLLLLVFKKTQQVFVFPVSHVWIGVPVHL